MMNYIFAGIALVVIIVLLNFLARRFNQKKKGKSKIAVRKDESKKTGLLVECPLCKTPLLKGEDLISRVYRPMNVPDQLCTINGCPHCFPVVQSGLKRICPVCHKEVPLKDGHLIARLFNKSDGKKHVVVTGCTECCKGAK